MLSFCIVVNACIYAYARIYTHTYISVYTQMIFFQWHHKALLWEDCFLYPWLMLSIPLRLGKMVVWLPALFFFARAEYAYLLKALQSYIKLGHLWSLSAQVLMQVTGCWGSFKNRTARTIWYGKHTFLPFFFFISILIKNSLG